MIKVQMRYSHGTRANYYIYLLLTYASFGCKFNRLDKLDITVVAGYTHFFSSCFRRAFQRFYQKYLEAAYPIEEIFMDF